MVANEKISGELTGSVMARRDALLAREESYARDLERAGIHQDAQHKIAPETVVVFWLFLGIAAAVAALYVAVLG